MTRFAHDPPPPPRTVDAQTSFTQRVELLDGKRFVGGALWHLPAGNEGVVQLVELVVHPDLRRHGHAGALLNEVIAQAKALCRARRQPLRRVWVGVEHKTQVIARSFLTKHGFHHTATIADLLRDQDLLVYVRSFD
jgi:ribosomal protein S18 acetylase RimI-like enzyme